MTSAVRAPKSAARNAATTPAGPAPMTRTSIGGLGFVMLLNSGMQLPNQNSISSRIPTTTVVSRAIVLGCTICRSLVRWHQRLRLAL